MELPGVGDEFAVALPAQNDRRKVDPMMLGALQGGRGGALQAELGQRRRRFFRLLMVGHESKMQDAFAARHWLKRAGVNLRQHACAKEMLP